jgi:recombination protein RecR
MKRAEYPAALKTLIAELKRMPGVGPRSAERIALWMVQNRDARPQEIVRALADAATQIRLCTRCGFFATGSVCEICADPDRDPSLLCVVEQPTDILPLERTGAFRGPDELRIDSLIRRVADEKPTEIILALNSDVEGEATASYIAGLLREQSATVTRIAQGLPAGGGLEFADELTLTRALSGRRAL